ncbi:M6 metalloprotease [Thozetella sp. PMI_491]|nr:M6 metalloprotease [Thozetella sp. PMI_491]
MAPRCEDSQCAVPPHPDLLIRRNAALLNVQSGDNKAATSTQINEFGPGHGTGYIPGLNDGLIFPKSHFHESISIRTMTRAALERAPLRGPLNAVLVLVDFQDVKMPAGTKERFEKLFFSTGQLATGSVKEYYEEVSGGKISLAGDVLGPFTLSHDKAYYANGNYGRGWPAPNSMTMADEAVSAAMGQVNFDKYDNDGNGYIDAFCVVHAGSGAEQTGNLNDIWSVKWTIPNERQLNNVKVYGFLTIPQDAKVGVSAHELGHLLFGWPDLYDTDSTSAGIGNWCLMSYGSWGGGGDRPVHPSAWCKANQGWIDVTNETENHQISLPDVKSCRTTHRLWKDGDTSSQEYFLLENRQLTGFDGSLPASGLLVWHVDDSVDSNTNEWHPKIGLLQADGFQQLEAKTSFGDGGDPFPGVANNTVLNATSHPNSKSYAGTDTFVSVTNIPPSAPTMSVNITVKATTPPPTGPFDPKMWYRLTNTFAGYALDVINDGGSNTEGLVQMSRIGNFSGQFWQIVPNGAGTYALRTLFLRASRQLDVYGNDKTKPHLATAGPFSGQIWEIAPWGDGSWHLNNLYGGKDLYLDTMEGGPRVAMNQANIGRPTERWNITPIRPITESGF